MIVLTMTSAMFLAASQASITAPRMAFANCLKKAETSAKAEKVLLEAYPEYLKAACGTQGEKLRTALVAFDVKNGVPRARAATDAASDVADGFSSSESSYKWVAKADAPAADAN
ncbi:MAG TPA: hypothetical protein VF637_04645 [Sphingomicrobium sp.]|jgi:hypothetical protein